MAGQAGLNVAAALALGAGPRALAGALAREAIELSVEPAGGELGGGLDLLAAFPPLSLLRALRDYLRRGLCLADLCPLRELRV
jgi:hypothetical protein